MSVRVEVSNGTVNVMVDNTHANAFNSFFMSRAAKRAISNFLGQKIAPNLETDLQREVADAINAGPILEDFRDYLEVFLEKLGVKGK